MSDSGRWMDSQFNRHTGSGLDNRLARPPTFHGSDAEPQAAAPQQCRKLRCSLQVSAQVSALCVKRQQATDDVFNSGCTELETGTEPFTRPEKTADDGSPSFYTVSKIDA